jgi:DNA-binding XRE family transcriptional regulator
MSVPTKTRRTRSGEVTVRVPNGMVQFQVPKGRLKEVLDYLSEIGSGKKMVIRSEQLVTPEQAFGDLYAETSKPATVLRGFRGRDELTQAELAKRLGTTQANVAAMESAKRPIGKDMARRLAKIFKTDYRVFL